MQYTVQRLDPQTHDPGGKEWWKDLPEAKVDRFPFANPGEGYRPATSARLGHDGSSLYVYMETDETDLRMETKGFGYVHTDSCMEFFVSPDPASQKYLNFEFNPAGAMFLAIGTGRYDREILSNDNYRDLFKVNTTVHQKGWSLEFAIPLSWLKQWFAALELKPGLVMKGNFYKCGDNTSRPHYGCWSPIDTGKPDFHCPRFFGDLILE